MTIPDSWRGRFSPRDPLSTPRPRSAPEPVRTVGPDPASPPAEFSRRVETERGAMQDGITDAGRRILERAGVRWTGSTRLR